jgi:uncharacterized repeat protein (TIGR01451 family)
VRKATFAAVLATVAVGALALAGAGSAAHTNSGGLATLRAANANVGATVVRQVGLRNYAGPNCPGRGWNCTTSKNVRQIATAGGTNVGVCTGSSVSAAPNQNCVIVQTGASNTARCTEQTSASDAVQKQSCDITQTGAANYAYINQNINQSTGFNQVGTQTAKVTQSGATVTNYLQLSQAANQSSKTGTSQNQNADQSATIEQTASGAGTNYSALNQTQVQKAYARDTDQTQDGTSNLDDCNPYTLENPQPGPDHPNACAVVLQHSAAGKNTNQLRQNISQDENSTVAAVQTQGSFDGGLDGRVHQDTVSGSSLNSVNQSKLQTQTAPKGLASTQEQNDPISCCGFASQVGGTGDKETINQSSALSASGDPFPSQFSSLIGTSHTPVGTCTISQKGSVNGASANNSDTLTPTCPFLTLETTCSSGNTDAAVRGGGSCTASAPDTTNPFPPLSSVVLGVRNVTNGETAFSSSTTGVFNDTLQYQVVYANSGTGAAHNVSFATPVPLGTTISFLSGNLTCPQTASIVGTTMNCLFGPTADPGTVASDTLLVFRVATFTVQVVPGAPGCGTLTDTVGVHTDEEGTVNSNQVSVILPACIT